MKKKRKKEFSFKKPEKRKEFPLKIVLISFLYPILFTPLLVGSRYYFPYVGPKSLFFMGGVEILFFIWLYLAIRNKEFRPKINILTFAILIYLFSLILSSLVGVDFSRSFWSKFERMTGLLMWFHLVAFYFVLSSCFKEEDWRKIFLVSVGVATLVSVFNGLDVLAKINFPFVARRGSTLGNSSFLGTYLLFNFFFAIWLFFKTKNYLFKAVLFTIISFFLFSMKISGARAAFFASLGGVFLLALLWLGFAQKDKKLKIISKIFLVIFIATVLVSIFLTFIPGTFFYHQFIKFSSQARFVNWEIAKKAFLEKPIFGWGPENYILAFPKYFNPCLFLPECGGEVWFDRSHNIIFDTLTSGGIFGLLSYLGIFFAVYLILRKKYFLKKEIDFFRGAIPLSCLASYFVQNLTVFDMVGSLMMFFLLLGEVGSLAKEKENNFFERRISFSFPLAGILFLVFLVTFYEFILLPRETGKLVINTLADQKLEDILKRQELYKKTLQTSPLGKYQIRDFFGQITLNFIRRYYKEILQLPELKEAIENELAFLTKELEKSLRESPLDYRVALKLTQLYSVYGWFDSQKFSLAESSGKRLFKLSPKNQQTWWAISQLKIYQKDFSSALKLTEKAINLEPRYLKAYKIAIEAADFSGDLSKKKEIAKKGLKIGLSRIKKFPNNFSYYKTTIEFAKISEQEEKVREVAKEGLKRVFAGIKKNPKNLGVYNIGIDFAKDAKDQESLKKIGEMGLEIAFELMKENPKKFINYQLGIRFAKELKKEEIVREIFTRAKEINPRWEKALSPLI